jgi:V/A-type H+-transporting ATPase subunit C
MAHASQAIIPKARGMYAKRILAAEYEELMRRRTVPEVAAVLKKHPYFADSLATLSPTDPHREQLEELLSMDIFVKYEALMRYDFTTESFANYFIIECEVQEILRVLRMLSTGVPGRYMKHLPPFLEGSLRFDLFRLAEARSFDEVLEELHHTPYYKVLRSVWVKDPFLRDYPGVEAVMVRYYYAAVFELAQKHLPQRALKAVAEMFSQEAEIYNIGVILRARTYFGAAFTAEQVKALLLPYNYRLTKRDMQQMLVAPNADAAAQQLGKMGLQLPPGPVDVEALDAEMGRLRYHKAQQVLHLSAAPSAVLAVFITLAKLERDNVVNVIEGVRYGLPPDKIRALLRY